MLEYVNKLHDESLELSSYLEFNKRFQKDGLIVSLYYRLIELTGGMLVQIDTQRLASVPIIFRSFLETYVDFVNLMAEPTYLKHMEAANIANQIKHFESYFDGNPYNANPHELGDIKNKLEDHIDRLKILEADKYGKLTAFRRFELADMKNEYWSIYRFASSQAHGDLGAIFNNHIVANGDSFNLVIYQAGDKNNLTAELDSIAGLLMDATRRIHGRLKSDCEKEILELDKALTSARANSPDGDNLRMAREWVAILQK